MNLRIGRKKSESNIEDTIRLRATNGKIFLKKNGFFRHNVIERTASTSTISSVKKLKMAVNRPIKTFYVTEPNCCYIHLTPRCLVPKYYRS